ncbi:hypothetical protein ACM66B_005826 [Microbotryomycetes sp. NB124-2]
MSALDDVVITRLVTSTSTRLATSTLPSSTITSASPLVTRLCDDLASVLNGTALDPICSLVTSLVPTVTVVPGETVVATELETVILTSLSTSAGGFTTQCSVLPTTTTTTTRPTRTRASTSSEPSESSETVAASTDPNLTTSETTTSQQALPTQSDLSTVDPIVLVPSSSPTSESSSSREGRRSTITSFRTVVVTSIDSNGQLTVVTTSSASLNTVAVDGGSSSGHAGAIAGGVVGGIAALSLLMLLLFLFRRKGLCRRDPEHFDDDVWAPNNHSPGDSGHGPLADDDSLLNVPVMSEKDDQPSALSRSATNATSPASDLAHRRSINSSVHLDRHGGAYGPAGGYEIASDGSLARQQSRHMSMKTSSSHGHESEHLASHDPRLAYEANGPVVPPSAVAYPAVYSRSQVRRPVSHYVESRTESGFGSRHDRSWSEGGLRQLSSDGHSGDLYHASDGPQRIPSITTSRTLPHNFATVKARPHLAVLTNESSPSSSTDSSGVLTSSSVSTAPTSIAPTTPLSPLEKELARAASLSDTLAPPKRPQLDRNHSTESFIVPSQYLGARIANADPSNQSFMTRTDSRASDVNEILA